jgi:predicted O-linked N-acetylglucosamine transferase (SPINDLY family)
MSKKSSLPPPKRPKSGKSGVNKLTKSAPVTATAQPAATPAPMTPQQIIAILFENAAKIASVHGLPASIAYYQRWLAQNPQFPFVHAVRYNLAVQQSEAGQLAESEQTLRETLERYPGFHQARFALGSLLEKQGKKQQAIDTWQTILQAIPDNASGEPQNQLILALNNSGRLLENMDKFAQAEAVLTRSLHINPKQPSVIHHWVHLRQKQCEWPIYPEMPGLTKQEMIDATSALAMLDVTDDPEIQLAAAKRFVAEKINLDVPQLANPQGYSHNKIRIGYLSSDFALHPVSMLMVEMFELHDRNRFEVYGFEWSPEDGSDLRARVLKAMDKCFRIKDLSDEQAAQLICQHEIDVLFDLQGLTAGARPQILAYKPAPIQISYLGFPGTSGMPFIDYILCDRYLIPEQEAQHYSEKPLYLPFFQVSDRKRQIAPTPTRAECGLPEDAFVYCAFNNNHKYTPEMFSVWMNILRQVPNSVLWLLASNESVEGNLRKFAEGHGVEQKRLIFAPKVHPAVYLARYRLADLFLDCFPFNGGTTANDALFMGLPIITISGRCFASRMAGSLLTFNNLEELITSTFAQYQQSAVLLATDNINKLLEIRDVLSSKKNDCELFDTPSIVKFIEATICECSNFANISNEVSSPADCFVDNESRAAKINLFMIAYLDEHFDALTKGMSALDNRVNDRPDWMEYWPIRRYLYENRINNSDYYGFFSPKFSSKTGLDGDAVKAFLRDDKFQHDFYLFSPQADMNAFFLNPFEQNELFDNGFIQLANDVARKIGYNINLINVVMDSRKIVFSNYFVAKGSFWVRWLNLCEIIYRLAEDSGSDLSQQLNFATTYRGGIQRKVFLVERMASMILLCDDFSSKPYSTFKCAWSALPTGKKVNEAIMSDALKMAFNDTGDRSYLDAYANLRKSVFGIK